MIYDCFISYQHDSIVFVENLVKTLESKGIKCWYAPRDIFGRYAKAIAYGISHSKVFLLVLNTKSALSEEVLNEVEMAHNIEKQTKYADILPLCIEGFDFDSPEYHEIMYYIRRRHFVMAIDDVSVECIADRIIENRPELKKKVNSRSKSSYTIQEKEDIRISKQNALLELFDKDIYYSVLKDLKTSYVLDLGCGTGDMLITRLADFKTDFSNYLGIDKSERQIRIAVSKYEQNANIQFLANDVEKDSFRESLDQYCSKHGITSFNFINISMLLLHLENPGNLLKIIHEYLAEDGIIIIRDIDDGINFAYPDNDNDFARIYRICERDEQSGFRKTGRQIYYDLVNAGFKHVSLVKQGLSTIGMTTEQKQTLFQMYFPFTLENAKIMSEKYPWNKEMEEEYKWYNSCYDSIYERFMRPEFVFSLGFMVYTAEK